MGESFFAVAPTDGASEHNRLRRPLRPVAIWELTDAHFSFDSSVLLPSMTGELADLVALVEANPEAPLAVFGHADPTGEEGYNKLLSGRRATALYAFLTRRADLWDYLHQHPMGRDDWKKGEMAARVMRSHLKLPEPTGPGAATPALFKQYMDSVGVDPNGSSFSVPASRFLGGGKDSQGKVDYQGCGEFNPLLVFSAEEAKTFAAAKDKTGRDQANAPNRRVTVMLFPPGTTVDPAKWPCPRVGEGVAGCRKRFWSDAVARRENRPERREYPAQTDTFACRFYDRFAMSYRTISRKLPFHYAVQVDDVPWTERAVVRFVSEDGADTPVFPLSGGDVVGHLRIVRFANYRSGVRYRAELVEDPLTVELFGWCDLSALQDPEVARFEYVPVAPVEFSGEGPSADPPLPIPVTESPDRMDLTVDPGKR